MSETSNTKDLIIVTISNDEDGNQVCTIDPELNKNTDPSSWDKAVDYWHQFSEYARTHDLGDNVNRYTGYYVQEINRNFDHVTAEIAFQHPELSNEQVREVAFSGALSKFGMEKFAEHAYGDENTDNSMLDATYSGIVEVISGPISDAAADDVRNLYLSHIGNEVAHENGQLILPDSVQAESVLTPSERHEMQENFHYTPPEIDTMPIDDPVANAVHQLENGVHNVLNETQPIEPVSFQEESRNYVEPHFNVNDIINSHTNTQLPDNLGKESGLIIDPSDEVTVISSPNSPIDEVLEVSPRDSDIKASFEVELAQQSQEIHAEPSAHSQIDVNDVEYPTFQGDDMSTPTTAAEPEHKIISYTFDQPSATVNEFNSSVTVDETNHNLSPDNSSDSTAMVNAHEDMWHHNEALNSSPIFDDFSTHAVNDSATELNPSHHDHDSNSINESSNYNDFHDQDYWAGSANDHPSGDSSNNATSNDTNSM